MSRRRILEAAVKLVDREGLDALSMRRLGRELGVEAMSLYNHVPNKGALLNGMVEILLEGLEVPAGAAPGGTASGWEERVREAFRAYRGLALAHPNVFPLFATRPLNTVESLRTFVLLREAGFDTVSALRAFRSLSSYTVGYALAEIRGFALDLEEYKPGIGGFSEKEFARVFGAPRPEGEAGGGDHDAEFDYGLDLIIAGLRAQLEKG